MRALKPNGPCYSGGYITGDRQESFVCTSPRYITSSWGLILFHSSYPPAFHWHCIFESQRWRKTPSRKWMMSAPPLLSSLRCSSLNDTTDDDKRAGGGGGGGPLLPVLLFTHSFLPSCPRRPDSAHTTSLPEPSPLNRTGSINGLKKLQEISGNVPNSRLRSDSGTTPPFLCVVCGTCGRHMAGSASEEDDALGERRGGAAAPNGTSEHCPVQECAAHLTPLMLRRPAFKHMSLSDGAGCLSK